MALSEWSPPAASVSLGSRTHSPPCSFRLTDINGLLLSLPRAVSPTPTVPLINATYAFANNPFCCLVIHAIWVFHLSRVDRPDSATVVEL